MIGLGYAAPGHRTTTRVVPTERMRLAESPGPRYRRYVMRIQSKSAPRAAFAA